MNYKKLRKIAIISMLALGLTVGIIPTVTRAVDKKGEAAEWSSHDRDEIDWDFGARVGNVATGYAGTGGTVVTPSDVNGLEEYALHNNSNITDLLLTGNINACFGKSLCGMSNLKSLTVVNPNCYFALAPSSFGLCEDDKTDNPGCYFSKGSFSDLVIYGSKGSTAEKLVKDINAFSGNGYKSVTFKDISQSPAYQDLTAGKIKAGCTYTSYSSDSGSGSGGNNSGDNSGNGNSGNNGGNNSGNNGNNSSGNNNTTGNNNSTVSGNKPNSNKKDTNKKDTKKKDTEKKDTTKKDTTKKDTNTTNNTKEEVTTPPVKQPSLYESFSDEEIQRIRKQLKAEQNKRRTTLNSGPASVQYVNEGGTVAVDMNTIVVMDEGESIVVKPNITTVGRAYTPNYELDSYSSQVLSISGQQGGCYVTANGVSTHAVLHIGIDYSNGRSSTMEATFVVGTKPEAADLKGKNVVYIR